MAAANVWTQLVTQSYTLDSGGLGGLRLKVCIVRGFLDDLQNGPPPLSPNGLDSSTGCRRRHRPPLRVRQRRSQR